MTSRTNINASNGLGITSPPAAALLGMHYLPDLAHCFRCMHYGGHWRAGSVCCRIQGRRQSGYH
ncbi:hypothetical protein RS421_000531 [Enterobacter kobei]|nr:hypothetical protein [Enterobacter kobei]